MRVGARMSARVAPRQARAIRSSAVTLPQTKARRTAPGLIRKIASGWVAVSASSFPGLASLSKELAEFFWAVEFPSIRATGLTENFSYVSSSNYLHNRYGREFRTNRFPTSSPHRRDGGNPRQRALASCRLLTKTPKPLVKSSARQGWSARATLARGQSTTISSITTEETGLIQDRVRWENWCRVSNPQKNALKEPAPTSLERPWWSRKRQIIVALSVPNHQPLQAKARPATREEGIQSDPTPSWPPTPGCTF